MGEEGVSAVLIREENKVQKPVYYVSRALQGVEARYSVVKRYVLTLVHAVRKLRSYFQSHPIVVVTDQPLKQILSKPDVSGRMVKWVVELSEYDLGYQPRTAIKAQALADFITEGVSLASRETEVDQTREAEMAVKAKGSADNAHTRQTAEALQAKKATKAAQTQEVDEALPAEDAAEVAQANKVAEVGQTGDAAEADRPERLPRSKGPETQLRPSRPERLPRSKGSEKQLRPSRPEKLSRPDRPEKRLRSDRSEMLPRSHRLEEKLRLKQPGGLPRPEELQRL